MFHLNSSDLQEMCSINESNKNSDNLCMNFSLCMNWLDGRWRPRLPPIRTTGERWRGGLSICLIKVADLRFLLCKDGDLPEAGPSWSGRSGEFRKAPPVNVTVHLCLESTGSGGIRSCAPMLLFRPLGYGGSGVKLRSLLPSGDI
jgi:hypothetical protein